MNKFLCIVLSFLPLVCGHAKPGKPYDSSNSNPALAVHNRYAWQAAKVAVYYLNYRSGSPNKVFTLDRVRKASLESIQNAGHKYYVQFTVGDVSSNGAIGTCIGKVIFQKQKPRPATDVKCKFNKDLKRQVLDADHKLYHKLKKQKKLLAAKNIPDNFGHVDPPMEPIWHMAMIGSSYVMWQKSTENLQYNLMQVKQVKQWKRKDDLFDFDFKILLHEIPTQEMIPCHMRMVWHPKLSPKVKYHCVHRFPFQEAGSGQAQEQEGSATGGVF
ncbi:latexin [Latimeria chalumnae]|uniref:Retinoic acid receptor responder 1 n=1 Tax=Latimeria chalumnae TaxID=7897 RepID=H3AXH5_LATCH|nr:PREDICTED: latexin [Latimeria chalumnae]|eukprot:XP_006002224.1 PREDICTED: latexin [Latimeria chalumnae]